MVATGTPTTGTSTPAALNSNPGNHNDNNDNNAYNNDAEDQALLPPEIVSAIRDQRNATRLAPSDLIKIIEEVKARDPDGGKLRLSEPCLPWGWGKLAPSLLLRAGQIAIICIVFWLGGSQRAFNLNDSQILQNIMVSVDTQLAVFGLANKILDYLLENALEHAVSVTLTLWMACSISDRYSGIMISDFSMKDELSKPWVAISTFVKRWRKGGLRWTYVWRLLIGLTVSICVLLQGAGVNTIGIPKARWYPSYWGGVPDTALTLTLPLMRIVNTNVDGLWSQATSMVGEPTADAIGQIVAGLSASLTFLGLSGLRSVMNSNVSEPGWYEAYKDAGNYLTGINVPTNTSQRWIRTVSLQFSGMTAIWTTQVAVGSDWARSSTGYTGILNLTLPFLETECSPSSSTEVTNGTMAAQPPVDMNSTDATFFVLVGASGSFTGANCSVTFRQGLFPVKVWILQGGEPDASLTNYNQPSWFTNDFRNPPTYMFEPTTNDTLIALTVTNQFNSIVPNLFGLVQRGPGLTDHLLALSRQFVALNRTGFDSDAAGFAPIVGTLLSQMMSTTTWLEEGDPGGATVNSSPVQWQGYGSSPRLPWEWTISIVLAVIVFVALWDIYLILRYRLSGLPLQEPGDLLLRKPMGADGLSYEEKMARNFYLRETAKEAFVTVDKNGGEVLKRDGEYRWRD